MESENKILYIKSETKITRPKFKVVHSNKNLSYKNLICAKEILTMDGHQLKYDQRVDDDEKKDIINILSEMNSSDDNTENNTPETRELLEILNQPILSSYQKKRNLNNSKNYENKKNRNLNDTYNVRNNRHQTVIDNRALIRRIIRKNKSQTFLSLKFEML